MEGKEEVVPHRLRNSRKLLEGSLEKLFEKKIPIREKALALVVDILTNTFQCGFVKDKCITLLYVCLNSIKKGSKKEICLASRVIGLLSLTAGCMDDLGHDILKESISSLSEALQSYQEPMVISSLLDCLAIVTVVGANSTEEAETSMQYIWKFVSPKSDSYAKPSGSASQLLKTATSAWSFVLATLESWNINPKIWKGAICHLADELDTDNISVRIAVGETLALIFELGDISKFYSESESFPSLEGLKDTILEQVRNLIVKAGDKGSENKVLNKRHQTLFHDILRFLKSDYSPETTVKIGRNSLMVSSWSQMIQVNYLQCYLGGGFLKHAQENEMLRDFLGIKQKRKDQSAGYEYDISSDVKATTSFVFEPELRKGRSVVQRMYRSPNSLNNKARTKVMNKIRVSSRCKNVGHFEVSLVTETEEI